MGVAPVISYNYGAKNTGGLKSVCKSADARDRFFYYNYYLL